MNPTISIKPYVADDAPVWDRIVRQSCNGNFLHVRQYMDYHNDRFVDCSLIVSRHGKPVAVFPASRHDRVVRSHGGLTYGGLIHTDELGAQDTLCAFEAIAAHYRDEGVDSVLYKAVPQPFHRRPSQGDLYALTRCGAQLVRRDASSIVFLAEQASFSKGRKWAINKARKAQVAVRRSHDLAAFHALLGDVLKKFGATPTHSLHELQLLSARFPDEIALHIAERDGTLLAGTLIYDFGHIVHTQYMANSDAGREEGALDLLIAELIRGTYADRQFFSFGISTEHEGTCLNEGLIAQKEAFGARTIVHDFYQWPLVSVPGQQAAP
ncbi:GNAT family N-acetyltransferase [Paraburkholderia bannensis]|uniref:GNAT family N-acetyltransferase n=1 Tax=Paraburkholderia bannensis TaxID=765414 RepID=UPI002ABE0D50|nr:GNAT family N-acetyltransferase [Paraburkholderia bannensis]